MSIDWTCSLNCAAALTGLIPELLRGHMPRTSIERYNTGQIHQDHRIGLAAPTDDCNVPVPTPTDRTHRHRRLG